MCPFRSVALLYRTNDKGLWIWLNGLVIKYQKYGIDYKVNVNFEPVGLLYLPFCCLLGAVKPQWQAGSSCEDEEEWWDGFQRQTCIFVLDTVCRHLESSFGGLVVLLQHFAGDMAILAEPCF